MTSGNRQIVSERLFPDRPLTDAIAEAWGIVETAKAEYGPVKTWLLLSGGDDSMVLLDVCKQFTDGIAHINTGIGVAESHQFAREQMKATGLPWVELHPPISYRDLVLGRWQGFPGPGFHGTTYQRLKERCVRQLVAQSKRKYSREKVMLLTGVRKSESKRRMGYSTPVDVVGPQLWVNPLLTWSNAEMREYRQTSDPPLARNPVAINLHMSGECLCGAMADEEDQNRQELEMLKLFYPETYRMIMDLETEVQARGLPYGRWGQKRKGRGTPGPLCNNCTLFEQVPSA